MLKIILYPAILFFFFSLGTLFAPPEMRSGHEKCHIEAQKVFTYLYFEDMAFVEASKCLDMAPECREKTESAISQSNQALGVLKMDLMECFSLTTPAAPVSWRNQREQVMEIRSFRGFTPQNMVKGALFYQLYKKSHEKKLPEQRKQLPQKENPSPHYHTHDYQNPKGHSLLFDPLL